MVSLFLSSRVNESTCLGFGSLRSDTEIVERTGPESVELKDLKHNAEKEQHNSSITTSVFRNSHGHSSKVPEVFGDASAVAKNSTQKPRARKEKALDMLLRNGNLENTKLFKCDYCGERFYLPRQLLVYFRVHYDGKFYSCDDCGKKFCQLGSLSTHLRTHTGARPFKCDLWGKGFCEKRTLSAHLRIHTGEKSYMCDLCGRRFIALSGFFQP